ncbi:MAG: hypothetical protein K2W82_11280 [Candidatus Obscuribacterales bacterium]|nr:hypothetical protein [Candidatus Obscuribacterales bacterium]
MIPMGVLRWLLRHKQLSRLALTLTSNRTLVDFIQQAHFNWFRNNCHRQTGLAPDRDKQDAPASIAATGFALTAFPIAVENAWIEREEAITYTLRTLRTLYRAPQGESKEGQAGCYGFFYHFLDPATCTRATAPKFWDSELSTIDTALLMAGVLFCQNYFDKKNAAEAELRELACNLYERVEWNRFVNQYNLILHAWSPERGMWTHVYQGYSEALLLYLLALGSPTHPAPQASWKAYIGKAETGHYAGHTYIKMPGSPLFCYQYPHCWIDFAGIKDDTNRRLGLDYAESSKQMTLAQQAYGRLNPKGFRSYSALNWGWTACDGPGNYSERGAPEGHDDGTIAPTAALSSLPFAPDVVMPTARHWLIERPELFDCNKGFVDAFNPGHDPNKNSGWVDSERVGIDQGPIVLMLENFKTAMIWRYMQRNIYLRLALQKAGFRRD